MQLFEVSLPYLYSRESTTIRPQARQMKHTSVIAVCVGVGVGLGMGVEVGVEVGNGVRVGASSEPNFSCGVTVTLFSFPMSLRIVKYLYHITIHAVIIAMMPHGCCGVSDHWQLHYLFSRLFRRISKKRLMLRVFGPCDGNPTVDSPYNWPVAWKMFLFDDVIMMCQHEDGIIMRLWATVQFWPFRNVLVVQLMLGSFINDWHWVVKWLVSDWATHCYLNYWCLT